MRIEVHKYGGSSVANIQKIINIAKYTCAYQLANNVKVILVLSAMGDMTNQLLNQAMAVAPSVDLQALDSLLATGEQVSCSLMVMALQKQGALAKAVIGKKIGIRTDSCFGYASIEALSNEYLSELLNARVIPVVAGFQGSDINEDITTLGRGGSDISAIVIASMFNAICHIYTDVDGVYNCDPRVVDNAKLLSQVSASSMEQMAKLGAKVLHPKGVTEAIINKVEVWVKPAHRWHVVGTRLAFNNYPCEPVVAIDEDVFCISVKNLPPSESIRQLIDRLQSTLYSLDLLGSDILGWQLGVTYAESSCLLNNLKNYDFSIDARVAKVSFIVDGGVSNIVEGFYQVVKNSGLEFERVTVTNNYASFFVQKSQKEALAKLLHDYVISGNPCLIDRH